MTQITDPYAELGLSRDAVDADPRAVDKAYRKLAGQHHPDRGGDREKFERIGTAVAILRDPAKRAKFDRTGAIDDRAEQDQRTQAFAVITAHIGSIVNEYLSSNFDPAKNPERIDVVQVVRNLLQLEISHTEGAASTGMKHVILLDGMKRRLKRRKKATGSDMVSLAIDHQIANARQQIEALNEALELRKFAMTLLDDYTFEVDRSAATWAPGFSASSWPMFNGSGM